MGLFYIFFFTINWNNACLASNLSLNLLLWKRLTQTRSMQGKENNQWSLVDQWFSKPKNFKLKKVLNYQLSNSSPKMSNSTCCTKLNTNILLCRWAKQARNFLIIVVLLRQILMYYCVGKQSEPKNVKQYLFYQAKS